MTWYPVGEERDVIYTEGHLPVDWHTMAKALLGHNEGLDDRFECLEWWTAWRAKKVRIVHGWEAWAPPGEWYGGGYITWNQPQEDIPGWATLGEEVVGDEDDYDDIAFLGLDKWDHDAVAEVCANALPTVHLVAPGEGWPWLARIINPVTVLVRE